MAEEELSEQEIRMEKTLAKLRKDRIFEESEQGKKLAQQIKQEKQLYKIRQDSATVAASYENLGKQLKDSLFAPLDGLLKRIPEPLRILGKMAIKPFKFGMSKDNQIRKEEKRKGITQSGAFQEARGREISQKGFYKGTISAYAGLIPGLGMTGRGGGWLGFQDDGSEREKKGKAAFASKKVVNNIQGILNSNKEILKILKEQAKENKKGGLFGSCLLYTSPSPRD